MAFWDSIFDGETADLSEALAPDDVCAALAGRRFTLSSEKQTQAEVFEVLREKFGEETQREVRLAPGDVIDFLLRGIGVEVKLKSGMSATEIYRQLERYAKHEAVHALVLLTNRAMGLPCQIGGKPAFYVSLGGAWL